MSVLQARVLAAVRRYYDRHGIPPTVKEVADSLRLTVTVVHQVARDMDEITLSWTGPRPAPTSQVMELAGDAARDDAAQKNGPVAGAAGGRSGEASGQRRASF